MSQQPLDLNLLPERHQGFQLRVWHVALALVALGLLISLVPSLQAYHQERVATATVEKQLEQVMELLNTLEIDQDTLDDLDQRIAEIEQRTQRLKEEAVVLRQQTDQRLPGLITAIQQRFITADFGLTRLEQEPQRLIVQGYSYTKIQVLEYVRRLEASARFTNVRVETIESSESALLVSFTIVAEE